MDTDFQSTTLTGPVRPKVKRRQYSNAQKRQIVEECLTGHDSASVVARRHDINANLLFKWRRQYAAGVLGNEAASPALLPIVIKPSGQTSPPASVSPNSSTCTDRGNLEIHLAGGHHLVITGGVCPVTLRTALEVLST